MTIEKLTELIGRKPNYIHIEGINYHLDTYPYDNNNPCKCVYLDSIIIFIEIILKRWRSLEYPSLNDLSDINLILYTVNGIKKNYSLRKDGDGVPGFPLTDLVAFCKSQGVPYKII
jgi:hypothetical protein